MMAPNSNCWLVTGGCGFIGSNLVRLLLAERPELTIVNLDALTYAGNTANLADLPEEQAARHTLVKADIAEADAVRKAFLDHCMLVFPAQFLTVEDHMAFAARWGEFSITPFVDYLDGYPGVLPLSNRGKSKTVTENWHYDSTFLPEPPSMTILSARDVPVGGDTMWSNQCLAYETLSAGLKAMLDGMRAEFTGARLARLAGSEAPVPSSFQGLRPVLTVHLTARHGARPGPR